VDKINWDDITKFKPGDFSEDPDKYAEPELIYRLNAFRLKLGCIMHPSPVTGALARFSGGKSQHVVQNGEKSKATDQFPEGIPFATYSLALVLKLFKGIGVYLDTTGPDGNPWIMFHFDIRPIGFNYDTPLIWIAEKVKIGNEVVTKYRYPQYESKHWKLFQDEKLYRFKQFGIDSASKIS